MSRSVNIIRTIALTYLGLLFLLSNPTAGNLPDFVLTHEGYFPPSVNYKQFKPANLFNKQQECIVVKDNSYFEIFRFTIGGWKSFHKIPIAGPSSDTNVVVTAWTVGDLNDDGRDEIIVCINRSIRQYEWDGKRFQKKRYEFPYLADGILIGDVDNDGSNELVSFCYEHRPDPEDPGCKYYVYIAKPDKDRINTLWTDKGKLGYVKSNIIPSDNLVCIADIMNMGYNQLLVAKGQSDVSPTGYELLVWGGNELKLLKSFIVAKGTIVTKGHIEATPFLIGHVSPMKIHGKTMFSGSMVYPEFKQVLLKIENNRLTVIQEIFEHSGWVLPNRAYWMNIDGKGKGVLGTMELRNGRTKYVFYRSKL